MISYPAQILARFGRYEAVTSLGHGEDAELWKAWDPYLERFVLVVALPRLDQSELYLLGADLEKLLWQRLGDQHAKRRVLDFAPPSAGCHAFFVVELGSVPRGPTTGEN